MNIFVMIPKSTKMFGSQTSDKIQEKRFVFISRKGFNFILFYLLINLNLPCYWEKDSGFAACKFMACLGSKNCHDLTSPTQRESELKGTYSVFV